MAYAPSSTARSRSYAARRAGSPRRRRWAGAVRLRAGRLVYERPVWGHYAAVLVERWTGRVTAWNTVPAFEAVHWGKDGGHVYLSNRPLLVALALAGGRRDAVALSPSYLAEYLSFGYSMTGQSPFENVRVLPVDRAVQVHDGRVTDVEAPAGLTHPLSADHTPEEGADALADAMRASADRVQRRVGERPLQLRVSGGADSRLLIGLLRGRGMEISTLTYGQDHDLDVRLGRLQHRRPARLRRAAARGPARPRRPRPRRRGRGR